MTDIETIADEVAKRVVKEIDRLKTMSTPQRDYSVEDIRAMTGYSRSRISGLKLHGEYYMNGKRLFRREVIDYQRKMGLNLVEVK